MIEFIMEDRCCECCGEKDPERLWENQSLVKKKTEFYLFRVNLVVCRKCGFCFTSPAPSQEALTRYYADGLAHFKDIALPYSVEVRISLLKRYAVTSGVFVEISGDHPNEFHQQCLNFFKEVHNVELTEDLLSEYQSFDKIPANYADVIVHYDVLEHVINVVEFLIFCRRVLKENGLMICEVPNIQLYSRNLMLFEFEHVNHFSPITLAAVARICGFQLVEIDHLCSRPFGFSSVFRKVPFFQGHYPTLLFEYFNTLACVRGGIKQIDNLFQDIRILQKKIEELGKKGRGVVLWGVTDFLRRLLEDFQLPETAIVVDSDPRRSMHLEKEGISVFVPKDCLEQIRLCDFLFITAPRYQYEIKEWIKRETGRDFQSFECEVLGTGLSGEPLI